MPVSASSFRPARADLFFRSQDAFEMTFPDADHLEIRSMEGQVTRYRRAQPWTPSAADLQAADGRYESKELGATYEIVAGTNAITMRMEGAPQRSLELTPVERDAYMVRMVIARFRRDASGRVTGFDFSNPVVQHIAFTRLGDRAGATSDALIPVTKTPAAAATSPATLRLESFVGEYELAPGRTVTITLENGQLHGEPTGNPKRPLVHASGSTFHVGGPNAPPITVTFAVGADGRATGLVMSQNGEDRTLRKIR